MPTDRENRHSEHLLFATQIYRAPLMLGDMGEALRRDLETAVASLAVDDQAGRLWSRDNAYGGYTSYASLNDLPWRMPEFQELANALEPHVRTFSTMLDFDLGDGRLELDTLWVNVLEPGGHHAAHIHPHSVISGTYYVALPLARAGIRFEDPRHAMMMAAPPRKADARDINRQFVTLSPAEGEVLLWESWLRHDVPVNQADVRRISISFNCAHVDGDDDDA